MKRLLCGVLVYIFLLPNSAYAYLSLRQSDWSGGYGQQVWSDFTKFNEQYNIKYQTPGELTISQKPNSWYDSAWRYRVKIKIDNSDQIALDHFPVLVVLDHKQNIEYWKTLKETGADLRFTDEDGKTLIPHDTERWDQGGKSYIWVKIPEIKDHSKDYFYMYYGNTKAQSASNSKDVFDNKFVSVWHLNESQKNGTDLSDATNSDNRATLTNFSDQFSSTSPSQIGNGLLFDGSNDSLTVNNFPNVFDFNSSDGFTVSAWVNVGRIGGNVDIVSNWRNANVGGKTNHGMFFEFSSVNRTLRCAYRNNGTSVFDLFSSDGAKDYIPTNQWLHVVCSYNPRASTQNAKLYVNGALESVTANATSTFSITGRPLRIGTLENGLDNLPRHFEGTIDEIRISKIGRSEDWIKAEYKSETNNYLTYGNEEIYGSELISSIFDAGHGHNWGYLSYEANKPVEVKIRTGNDKYLADAPDFETCDPITNESDISTNNCVKDGYRYIQYQVILDENSTFKSISITDFLPSYVKPVVQGISTLAPTPQPSNNITIEPSPLPAPAPSPSPSLIPNHYPLTPIFDFFNALFH